MKCPNCGADAVGWHEGFRDGLNRQHAENAEYEELETEVKQLKKLCRLAAVEMCRLAGPKSLLGNEVYIMLVSEVHLGEKEG